MACLPAVQHAGCNAWATCAVGPVLVLLAVCSPYDLAAAAAYGCPRSALQLSGALRQERLTTGLVSDCRLPGVVLVLVQDAMPSSQRASFPGVLAHFGFALTNHARVPVFRALGSQVLPRGLG